MNFQNVSNRAKVFKALASDPNATKDTKDRVRQADQNEDKLYKVENKLFSSQILLEMGWCKCGKQKNGMICGKNGMMGDKNRVMGGKKWDYIGKNWMMGGKMGWWVTKNGMMVGNKWDDGWQAWQKTGWQTNT